ncbi:hypothetical protein HMPREF9123_2164 [Neisseria bacilliformis ATCC BAA-1200]|uniref:Uncharacterized protein n=1 Tax=Neisseria bacilliformis ATCC BAA-1200 TaxID=888742 RepID=F2BEK8_9NEIS|nr:hypothetical protein HMPREF9123_2164 [Neisseria bacilliformis ATCC BAA-1200]
MRRRVLAWEGADGSQRRGFRQGRLKSRFQTALCRKNRKPRAHTL